MTGSMTSANSSLLSKLWGIKPAVIQSSLRHALCSLHDRRLQENHRSDIRMPMESTIRQVSKSAFIIIGPEGATNFTIIKGAYGGAVLIDGDIRRIDEIEEALQLT